jgi:hypothetical protein
VDDALLDLAAPPTLPSLTERAAVAELVYAGAGVGRSEDDDRAPDDGTDTGFLWLSHLQAEVPLLSRSWHAGLAWDVASAAAPGKDRSFLYGNPELWARGIGFSESGLAGGGSLGVVVPLPRGESDAGLEDLVRVVRPWDTGYFSDTILTVRPAFDARAVLPPFVLQMRQGLDVSYGLDTGRGDFVARIATYVGWEPAPRVTVGLELWQIYSITAEVADDQRAAITLSPSIRLRTRPLEPGLSFLFPLSTPLEGIATAFFAARVHVRLALGDTADVTYDP